MAEVIFRVPSKKVQYGYMEVKIDVPSVESTFPDPSELGAMYTEYVSRFVDAEINGIQKVQKELNDAEAAQLLKDTLGATEIPEDEAAKPWNKDTKTESKPWESSPSSDDDWDL